MVTFLFETLSLFLLRNTSHYEIMPSKELIKFIQVYRRAQNFLIQTWLKFAKSALTLSVSMFIHGYTVRVWNALFDQRRVAEKETERTREEEEEPCNQSKFNSAELG